MTNKLILFWLILLMALPIVISQPEIPDYICSHNVTIKQTQLAKLIQEPLPYIIPYPNSTCFRPECRYINDPGFTYENVDLNRDGLYDATLLYTKYDKTQEIYNFTFDIKDPMITLDGEIILHKIHFCYINGSKAICDNSNIQANNSAISYVLKNRVDTFTSINFVSNEKIDGICPVSFDFGDWSKKYLYPVDVSGDYSRWHFIEVNITNDEYFRSSIKCDNINVTGETYNKTVILLGKKGNGVIITKPENYYFVFNNNKFSNYVLVCTKDQSDKINMIKGINLFAFAGIYEDQKVGALAFLLSLPSVSISVTEPQIVFVRNFLVGNVLPNNFQNPQMNLKLDFKMGDTEYGSWSHMEFTYKDWNGWQNTTIYPKDNVYTFDKTVILDGNPASFPILIYKTYLYNIYPKKISQNKIKLSFEESSSFTGYANFNKDKITVYIYPRVGLITAYIVSLITSFILFYFITKRIKSMKKVSFEPKNALELVGFVFLFVTPIFGSGFNYGLIISFGFLPHFICIIIIIYNLIVKYKKINPKAS